MLDISLTDTTSSNMCGQYRCNGVTPGVLCLIAAEIIQY